MESCWIPARRQWSLALFQMLQTGPECGNFLMVLTRCLPPLKALSGLHHQLLTFLLVMLSISWTIFSSLWSRVLCWHAELSSYFWTLRVLHFARVVSQWATALAETTSSIAKTQLRPSNSDKLNNLSPRWCGVCWRFCLWNLVHGKLYGISLWTELRGWNRPRHLQNFAVLNYWCCAVMVDMTTFNGRGHEQRVFTGVTLQMQLFKLVFHKLDEQSVFDRSIAYRAGLVCESDVETLDNLLNCLVRHQMGEIQQRWLSRLTLIYFLVTGPYHSCSLIFFFLRHTWRSDWNSHTLMLDVQLCLLMFKTHCVTKRVIPWNWNSNVPRWCCVTWEIYVADCTDGVRFFCSWVGTPYFHGSTTWVLARFQVLNTLQCNHNKRLMQRVEASLDLTLDVLSALVYSACEMPFSDLCLVSSWFVCQLSVCKAVSSKGGQNAAVGYHRPCCNVRHCIEQSRDSCRTVQWRSCSVRLWLRQIIQTSLICRIFAAFDRDCSTRPIPQT